MGEDVTVKRANAVRDGQAATEQDDDGASCHPVSPVSCTWLESYLPLSIA